MARDAPIIPIAAARATADLGARADDELMTLAAAGVVAAFGELVRRHERVVRGFCANMLGARDTADDVAQDVFLEVWRIRGRYQGQGRFRGYLFSAARNRCLNEMRGRRSKASTDARMLGHVETDVGTT